MIRQMAKERFLIGKGLVTQSTARSKKRKARSGRIAESSAFVSKEKQPKKSGLSTRDQRPLQDPPAPRGPRRQATLVANKRTRNQGCQPVQKQWVEKTNSQPPASSNTFARVGNQDRQGRPSRDRHVALDSRRRGGDESRRHQKRRDDNRRWETDSSPDSRSEREAEKKKRRRKRSGQESPRKVANRRNQYPSARDRKQEQPPAAQAPPVVAPSGSSTGRVVNPLRVQPPPAGAASSTSASRQAAHDADIRNLRQRIANLNVPPPQLSWLTT